MSIIDGICLAFIEGNCYNSSKTKARRRRNDCTARHQDCL